MKIAAATIATGIVLGLAAAQVEAGPQQYEHTRHYTPTRDFTFDTGQERVRVGWSFDYDVINDQVLGNFARLWNVDENGARIGPLEDVNWFSGNLAAGQSYFGGDWTMNIRAMDAALADAPTRLNIDWNIRQWTGTALIVSPVQTTTLRLASDRRVMVAAPGTVALLALGLLALVRKRRNG